MAGSAARPTGITIMAVLSAIFGVLGLLGSLTIIGLGGILGAATGSGVLGGLFSLIGVVVLVESVIGLVLAYGFWTLAPWAWQLGAALEVVSIATSVLWILAGASISSQVISIVIAGAILYYLNTPAVRQAFGRPATGWM